MLKKIWRWLKNLIQRLLAPAPPRQLTQRPQPPSQADEERSSEPQQLYDQAKEKFRERDLEGAISLLEDLIYFYPNYERAYNGRGFIEGELGRYEKAVDYFTKALELNSQFCEAYCNRGNAYINLESYTKAIDDFTEAIKIDRQHEQAYYGRSVAYYRLGFYREAIADCREALVIKPDLWQAWEYFGLAIFHTQGYQAAIVKFNEGLEKLNYNHPEYQLGCATLYYRQGEIYFIQAKREQDYWRCFCEYAINKYRQALTKLEGNNPKLRETYLEVSEDLVIAYRSVGDEEKAKQTWDTAIVILEQWLLDIADPLYKNRLSRKFDRLYQLEVDRLAQSTNLEEKIKALELAEARKNLCLTWMQATPENPHYEEILQLLNCHSERQQTITNCHSERSVREAFSEGVESQTSSCDEENSTNTNTQDDTVTNFDSEHQQEIPEILRFAQDDINNVAQDTTKQVIMYWHLSPVTITTFILKPDAELKTFSTPVTIFGDSLDFETWMRKWKQDYENSRKKTETSNTWQNNLDSRLNQLAHILNLEAIQAEINRSRELILIPHRDLHLLPLHYFFQDTHDTITYLPSAKIGLSLAAKPFLPFTAHSKLLIVAPASLLFAELEAAIVANFYQENTRIAQQDADKDRVIAAIQQSMAIFHFTGHAEHNWTSPHCSALDLAQQTKLTQKQILELDLPAYELVCLSACETGLTSKAELISEFIGLASTFLAKQTSFVLSTLWTVNERTTALIIIEFYRQLRTGKTPQVALKQAQNWLRSVTYRDLANWYRDLAADVAATNEDRQEELEADAAIIECDPAKMESNELPYQNAYFWAGFVLTGKVV
ncbi:MAG: CHAT domain-containing protein [Oscillatoria sp. PMC 1068.18]|nr:CHAT domain-containing protein [Oscillatoria sp. PMC 1076.18]MEC4987236.1 CHAT domain-containing protein [Oscillatoria sp. PMC 1068.18]